MNLYNAAICDRIDDVIITIAIEPAGDSVLELAAISASLRTRWPQQEN